jgi:hypothetical protein
MVHNAAINQTEEAPRLDGELPRGASIYATNHVAK